jgi:hypothetical protein
LVPELGTISQIVDRSFSTPLNNGELGAMSILNDVVAMNVDRTSTGYEEPSTPLRDPTSSPVIHIQWQNSQSACAAMEELRVASSVPRRRESLLS